MNDLTELSIHEAHQLLVAKKISARELTDAVLKRIEQLDSKINSFITVCPDLARSMADAVDRQISQGMTLSPLTGIPFAPKDIYLTEGVQTTAASQILKGYIPPYSSTAWSKIASQGAILIGKTNLDEFAMGGSNENSSFGEVHNPWDLTRVPGGSSGGSAAAVAADLCLASLGTDTGGSIRQPASHCGIVGIKPTYGRVSRYGTIAFASSLDQMGPMTKTVRDAALVLEAMAGHDPKDSTSINCPVPSYADSLGKDVRGLRIGVPREYFVEGVSPDVRAAVMASLKNLESMGAVLVDVTLPHTEHCVSTYYIIAPAEASSNLARYDGIRYGTRKGDQSLTDIYRQTKTQGFGPEVKRRILLGTYVLSAGYYDAFYVRAQKIRTLIRQDFLEAFESCDVIAGPVAPTTAFRLKEKSTDPMQMYLSDIFTISTNLAGLPGMSVPCGFDSNGLPIGLQLIGKAFDEATLLQVAYAHEQSNTWYTHKPKI